MRTLPFCVATLLCLCAFYSKAQNPDTAVAAVSNIPSGYYSKVDKKLEDVNDKLTKKSLKYLAKFQRQEQKMQEKLAKLNSENATTSLNSATEKYKDLAQNIKSKTGIAGTLLSGAYNPNLDNLGTSLSFLKQFNGISDKVKEPLKSFDALQSKLQQSDRIKEFIAERKNQIKELLSKYTNLPSGLKNQYAKLSKTAYYYSAQVKEYKEMLKDPDKMEKKALSVLKKLPAFQKFWQKNSQLAQLFPMPDDPGSVQSLAGLQTSASVRQMIQQRVAAGGPGAMAQVRQNLAAGQAELNKLKDKINSFGGGNSDLPMPDFKPNAQKTKPFLQRLEYGCNIQFEKSKSLIPSTSDIAASIGYKINDKSTAGIGLGYKISMGTIQHISFRSQGVGLRSFIDWKLKKQFYITGGYEMNYNSAFKNIEQLKNYDAWQRSGLIGLSKKYQISKKVKGNMQLLYDFLANTHIPVSEPVLFRLGYNFK